MRAFLTAIVIIIIIYIIFQITNIGITVQCTYRDMRNNVKSTIPGIDHKNKNILFEQNKKRYFQS